MRLLFTLAFALSCLVLAAIVTAALGYVMSGTLGMSDFEGQRAMFAVFVLGPLGALAGAAAGAVIGWRAARPPVAPRAQWLLAGTAMLATLGLLVAALG
jgi:hypothetical protein